MADDKKLDKNIEKVNLREQVLDVIEKKDKPPLVETGKESMPSPDKPKEVKEEKPSVFGEKQTEKSLPAPIQSASHPYYARQKRIELVLAKDLAGLYIEMPDKKRKEFKKQGEITAGKINELMAKGKATAKKMIVLIKKWLSLIPGVNKYFLEQEAKIKTDEILGMGSSSE